MKELLSSALRTDFSWLNDTIPVGHQKDSPTVPLTVTMKISNLGGRPMVPSGRKSVVCAKTWPGPCIG